MPKALDGPQVPLQRGELPGQGHRLPRLIHHLVDGGADLVHPPGDLPQRHIKGAQQIDRPQHNDRQHQQKNRQLFMGIVGLRFHSDYSFLIIQTL